MSPRSFRTGREATSVFGQVKKGKLTFGNRYCIKKLEGGGVMNKERLLKWAKAALFRAIRTFAEAMLSYIGTGAIVLGDVNWLAALSAGGMGFILAWLFALTGLPEVEEEQIE